MTDQLFNPEAFEQIKGQTALDTDPRIIRQSGEIPSTAAWAAIEELCTFYGPDARARIGARVAGDGRKFRDGKYLEVRIGYRTPCGHPESQAHLVGNDGKVR